MLSSVPAAGDDVGMVLSPQAFHNVNVTADIFNHCNINFWEYAQHGYDALGFISCTGVLSWTQQPEGCSWQHGGTASQQQQQLM